MWLSDGSAFDRRDPGDLSLGAKLLRFDWLLAAALTALAAIGFIMLYSVGGGSPDARTDAQIVRFALGLGAMMLVAVIDIRVWRMLAWPVYALALLLLIYVEIAGVTQMGATRWMKLPGGINFQPSEMMKIALVMALARYYESVPAHRVSHPVWLLGALLIAFIPAALVLKQPDLGTSLLLLGGGAVVMFMAGVSYWWFALAASAAGGLVIAVFRSQGTDWQLLQDYQFRRIEIFLDPTKDPTGAGWHTIQSTTAIGSGGLTGRGYLQGSQTHAGFIPEADTDFIFSALAEEFGFVGGVTVISLYLLTVTLCMISALRTHSMFGRLLAIGVGATFFFFFAINLAMVTGLAPVVGVPLPMISYGGSSMLTMMAAFGLLVSARVHDPVR